MNSPYECILRRAILYGSAYQRSHCSRLLNYIPCVRDSQGSLPLQRFEAAVRDVISTAQGEMALEEFLRQVGSRVVTGKCIRSTLHKTKQKSILAVQFLIYLRVPKHPNGYCTTCDFQVKEKWTGFELDLANYQNR